MILTDGFSTLKVSSQIPKLLAILLLENRPYLQYNSKSEHDFSISIKMSSNSFRLKKQFEIIDGPGGKLGLKYFRSVSNSGVLYKISDRGKVIFVRKKSKFIEIFYNRHVERSFNIVWIARIIRNILNGLFQNKGGFFLHASSFTIENKGVLVIGSKFSGKTTTSFFFARNVANSNLVSNDKTGIILDNGIYRIKGESQSLNIGFGMAYTIPCFSAIRDYLSKQKGIKNRQFDKSEKIRISIKKLQSLGFNFQKDSQCSCLLLPNINKSGVANISRTSVSTEFLTQNLIRGNDGLEDWLDILNPYDANPQLEHFAQFFKNRVGVLEGRMFEPSLADELINFTHAEE